MRDHRIWRRELIDEIRTIADVEELERLWSGTDPSSISSFAEEVAHVFDDYDLNGFITAGALLGRLRSEQFDALVRFRDHFAAYIDQLSPTPLTSIERERILGDPKWGQVTNAAREFIALIDEQ
jgi:hypothetical protein